MIREINPAARHWGMPLCTLFFLCALYWNGHGGDLGYWVSWMDALSRGYTEIHANYPPLLLHWFWLLGKLFAGLQLEFPPVSPVQLKFFVLLPVLASQMWLCRQVELLLIERGIAPLRSSVFWGVVASPALLLDGPVWGQVDLLPFAPMWLSLVYAFRARFFAAGAAFALALVCKFQAIVILPVLAGLFMHRWRLNTWYFAPQVLGGLLLVGVIAFLPFIWVGRFGDMFHAAYLGNANIFPVSTFNAANLWYLLVGNITNMHLPLASGVVWLTPHKLGLGLFLLVSVACMLRAWLGCRHIGEVIGLAMVMVLGFFTFAPSMHERYLFLLVPLAALGCARGSIHSAWLHLANLVVAVNILLVLPMSGDMVWRQLSWAVLALALVAGVKFIVGFERLTIVWRRGCRGIGLWISRLPRTRWLAGQLSSGRVLAMALVCGFGAGQLYQLYSLNSYQWRDGRLFLSDIREQSFRQDWGRLSRDRAVNNDPLEIFGHPFDKGLGVHAFSRVQYRIPEGAKYFHSFYGLNRSGEQGQVRFRVLLDGRTVWRSGVMRWQQPGEVSIPLAGAETLTLQVDGMGSIRSDHANWAEAGFWQRIPDAGITTIARR